MEAIAVLVAIAAVVGPFVATFGGIRYAVNGMRASMARMEGKLDRLVEQREEDSKFVARLDERVTTLRQDVDTLEEQVS